MILKDFLQLRKRKNLPSVVSITSRSKRQKKEIQISYTGNGFLHNMVRILTGTLVEVGCGKIKPEDITKALKSTKRSDAGITAPPQRVISGFCGVLRSNLILPRLPQQFLSLILVLPTVLLLLIYYRLHKKQIHTVGLGIVFPKECILLPV